MKKLNIKLLASASVIALGLGIASPAHAFDSVDWSWNNEVNSAANITVTVDDTFDWSGLTQVEKLQMNIGNLEATSTLSDIHNNPPALAEGEVFTIDEIMTITTNYDKNGEENGSMPSSGGIVTNDPNGIVDGTLIDGSLSEQENAFTSIVDIHLQGEFELTDLEGLVNDAEDLPHLESAATAVANNQSISSTSAMTLHDAQYNFGGFNGEGGLDGDLFDAEGNAHTDLAFGLTLAAAMGQIAAGSIDATSSVDNITNASVDSAATSVANNLSVTIEPTQPGDAFLMADLTQFNYANGTASSSVTDLNVNNYANLAALDGPLVSSVATAVGNNVSISVGNFAE
ncbi:MAG: hypothetical protein EA357_11580 [Micavibrio sp.]|jgi:hypothetical protein|nr:MAG: hypothetical protein EA357_11580 [Micavibrio sp.]